MDGQADIYDATRPDMRVAPPPRKALFRIIKNRETGQDLILPVSQLPVSTRRMAKFCNKTHLAEYEDDEVHSEDV